MKIFISWSGKTSGEIAKILSVWISDVIQATEPFISADIKKGARWFEVISDNLKISKFGIICVTKENLSKPWLSFEAGALSALSKDLQEVPVVPLFFGIKPSDLTGHPLLHFQATSYEESEIKK